MVSFFFSTLLDFCDPLSGLSTKDFLSVGLLDDCKYLVYMISSYTLTFLFSFLFKTPLVYETEDLSLSGCFSDTCETAPEPYLILLSFLARRAASVARRVASAALIWGSTAYSFCSSYCSGIGLSIFSWTGGSSSNVNWTRFYKSSETGSTSRSLSFSCSSSLFYWLSLCS